MKIFTQSLSAALLLVCVAGASAQTDYFVSAVSGDDTNSGLGGDPVATIAAAVALSNANPPATGVNTITVEAGSYLESLMTITQPVHIVGPQDGVDPRPVSGSTRLEGNPDEATVTVANTASGLFDIRSSNVEIRGLALVHSPTAVPGDLIHTQTPTLGTLLQGVRISHNIIKGNGGGDDALNLRELEGGIIDHNHIHDWPTLAIKVREDSLNVLIQNNEINNIRLGSASPSVGAISIIVRAENTQVIGNRIYNVPSMAGISFGNNNAETPIRGGVAANNTIFNVGQAGIVVNRRNTDVIGNDITTVFDDACVYLRGSNVDATRLGLVRILNNTLANANLPQSQEGGISITSPVIIEDGTYNSGVAIGFGTVLIRGNIFNPTINPFCINASAGGSPIDGSGNYFNPLINPTTYGSPTVDFGGGNLVNPPDSSSRLATITASIVINTDTTATDTVTITNSGALGVDGPVTVSNLLISGAGAASFSLENGPLLPVVLAPGDSTTVDVRFTSPGIGVQSATLTALADNTNGALESALTGLTFGPSTPATLERNAGTVIHPGHVRLIRGGHLRAGGGNGNPASLVYTVTTPPTEGTLSLAAFTQEDIDLGNVVYTHNGGPAGIDSFAFSLTSGTGSPINRTFTIRIFDALPDNDGDGLSNAAEAFLGTNPNRRDTSGDRLEDGLKNALGLSPTAFDLWTDAVGNGIPDSVDLGNQLDSDNDRYTDRYEYIAGRNPYDFSNAPSLGDVNGDSVVNNDDAIIMIEYFFGIRTLAQIPNPENFDVNRDGLLNNLDAIYTYQFAIGAQQTLAVD